MVVSTDAEQMPAMTGKQDSILDTGTVSRMKSSVPVIAAFCPASVDTTTSSAPALSLVSG